MEAKNAETQKNTLVRRKVKGVIEPRIVLLAIEFYEAWVLRC
jgi:hypothetical protein